MKYYSTLLLLLTLCISNYAQNTIINDPNAQLRQISSFTAIEIADGIGLYLSQGEEEGMAVSASTNTFRDGINTSVENGVLKIWYNKDNKFWVNGNKKLKAYVSFTTLVRLKASSASDVMVSNGIRADVLHIQLSGASDLKGRIEANVLNIEQSGASDATLSGKVNEINIDASGASDLDGYALSADTCNVKASGASDVKITVNKQLHANANGASSVKYRGTATVKEVKTSGASKVN